MTAIILAGGDGAKMRPLSCSMPKAMLNVCNIPTLAYVVKLLEKGGVDRIIIAADRLSGIIADYFDDADKPPLLFFTPVPEGTAAALSSAAESYDINPDEPVIVMRGDIITDIKPEKTFRFHKYSDAPITVTVKSDDRPYEHIAANTENDLLKDIFTSMPRESVAADKILTGIIVMRGKLAIDIKKYGKDIFTDVISKLITNSIKINAFEADGYYRELNTPQDLYYANADAANGLLAEAYPEFALKSDSCIFAANDADIAEDASISGFAVIGKGCTVGKNTKLHDCILFDKVYTGESCKINGAIIGKNAKICSGAAVFEGAVVGCGAVIEENAAVNAGVKIWDGRHVEPFACAADDLKYGFAKKFVIGDDGITGETNGLITPLCACVAGSAAAGIGSKAGIACRGTNASEALAMAAASGAMSSGCNVWFFGEATEPELAYCIKKCGLDCGLFTDAGINARIKMFSGDGMPLSREEEKIAECALNRGEYKRSSYSRFGSFRHCEAIKELYRESLLALLPQKLRGTRAVISTSGNRIADICSELVTQINDKNGEPVVFHISSDGARVSVYTEETGYIFHDKLIMLCCLQRFRDGKNAALPNSFPTAADRLAEEYGCKVLRWSGCPTMRENDAEARELAGECGFTSDGIKLMLGILTILQKSKKSLKELCRELPEFATVNRFIAYDVGKNGNLSVLRSLCSGNLGTDGGIIDDTRGRVIIRPIKTGKGVMMHVESYAAEIASELCDFYQDKLKKSDKS